MLVRNTWYVIAFSEEVAQGKPFARTVIGEAIVLFRNSQGRVAAMDDRCLHRRLPLSLGRVTADDTLVCAYHGLAYDGSGACVSVPGQATVPRQCVRTYPVEERNGLIWIWMGAAQKANVDAIFRCNALADARFNQTRLYRYARADYLLLNDNLADLSHVAFLHSSTAGTAKMADAETTLTVDGLAYHFIRFTANIPAPDTYAQQAKFSGNVDRWHVVDFQAPSFFSVTPGAANAGTGGPDSTLPEGSGKWSFTAHHLITPETEKTMHYFMVATHEWPKTPESNRFFNTVVDEDVWVIESQQRSIDTRPDAPIVSIESDVPMFEMRRLVKKMWNAENNARAEG